jgi:hypothetical protein
MSSDHPAHVISPYTAIGGGEVGSFPFDLFERRCLAQGDSWFSIGAIPPSLTSNVLAELVLSKSTVVVNCATPGAVLSHMADTTRERMFLRLLTGRLATKWDAILISGGGNDLIDAASVGPGADPTKRLLKTLAERGTGPLQGDDYVSKPGWQTFAEHLGAVFTQMVDARDSGINKGVPLLLHDYARTMPRPAPVGLGIGPWLQPAMKAFEVRPGDWLAVSDALMDRLRALLTDLVAARSAADPGCALHVVDTRAAPLVLAEHDATGTSGDFVNEIHPTRGGYAKLAAAWRASLDPLL